MGHFTTDLHVREICTSRARRWQLTHDLIYIDSDGNEHCVAKDSVTDFASVPTPLQWLVPRTGTHSKAAVVHDALWCRANKGTLDRRVADEVFLDALVSLGVPWLRRRMMWAAVRIYALGKRKNRGSWPLKDGIKVLPIAGLCMPIVLPTLLVVVVAMGSMRAVDFLFGPRTRPAADDGRQQACTRPRE